MSAQDWLRAQGLRVTPQRRLVLERLLQEAGRHWTADELHDALRSQLSELARGTVYNILAELSRVGLVEELPARDGRVLYGIRLAPHHHFHCDTCRRWFDVAPLGAEALALAATDRERFRVQAIDIVFRGQCAACADRAAVRTPG